MGIYAHWLLPIYCMFTVRESDIVDNAAMVTRRIVDEFRCADGWIGIVRYACFEGLLNREIDSENGISLHSPVFYGAPAPSVTDEAFQGTPYNLVIKAPNMRTNTSIEHRVATGRMAPDPAPKRNITSVFPRYSSTPKRANTQMAKGMN